MNARPWIVLGTAAAGAVIAVSGTRWVVVHLAPPVGAAGTAFLDAGVTIGLFALLALMGGVGMRRAALPLPGWGPHPGIFAGLGAGVGLAVLLAALADAALAGAAHRVPAHGSLPLLLLGTLVVAIQAGAEELFFRGWVQGALQRDWRAAVALAAGGLLFALLHLVGGIRAPLSMLNILLAGLLFGALRWRSGGLAAPMAAHVIYNWAEMLLFGLDPNPGTGSYGALVDLDLSGSAWWGGTSEGLNASIGLALALVAALLPLAFAWRAGAPAPIRGSS